MKTLPYALIGLSALMVGCGGSSSSTKIEETDPIQALEGEPTVHLGSLKPSSHSGFTRYVRNGLYKSALDTGLSYSTAEAVSDAATSSPSFSTTNTQESGVDEADRIEYDGDRLFIAARGYYEGPESASFVRVMQKGQDNAMSELERIAVPENIAQIDGLYLQHDNLVVLGSQQSYFIAWELWMSDIAWHQQTFSLGFMDVSEPGNSQLHTNLEIDGGLISSRRIDNMLYVVSNYSPYIESVSYGASTRGEKESNYNALLQTQDQDLLPQMSINGGEKVPLVTGDSCYVSDKADQWDGYSQIVTISAIDLNNPSSPKSVCVSTRNNGLYVSSDALYLLATHYNSDATQSAIHKFSFNGDQVEYKASGVVDGYFGSNNPSFVLGQQGDTLYALTSNNNISGTRDHKLYSLQENSDTQTLDIVATLPNESRPEPIGKPNESVMAVRYYGDRAFVVTFERIDPLYVLDLSSPVDPKIAGELEIPGFSSYLHPINDNLVIGVGQQVDPSRFQGDLTMTTDPIEEGAKLSIFDVSDISTPVEVAQHVFGRAYTPAEFDHHTFNWMNTGDTFRFTIPTESWIEVLGEDGQHWTTLSQLHMFEVNLNGAADLMNKGAFTVEAEPSTDWFYYISGWDDRAVLHDDQVFYIHGNQVFGAPWAAAHDMEGPF